MGLGLEDSSLILKRGLSMEPGVRTWGDWGWLLKVWEMGGKGVGLFPVAVGRGNVGCVVSEGGDSAGLGAASKVPSALGLAGTEIGKRFNYYQYVDNLQKFSHVNEPEQ